MSKGTLIFTAPPPLQNQPPLTDSQEIWQRWLSWRPLSLLQIWCKSAHGGFWAIVWNITNFLLFVSSFWKLIYRWPVGRFSHLMAQITQTHARVWCFVDTPHHLGGQTVQKIPIFRAWIGIFKPNMPNILNTKTLLQPFYGPLDFIRDYPGEPALER